jgi:hypothetical protein
MRAEIASGSQTRVGELKYPLIVAAATDIPSSGYNCPLDIHIGSGICSGWPICLERIGCESARILVEWKGHFVLCLVGKAKQSARRRH